jgi:F0F1-type ATP synthase epsilon subunit
VTKNTNPNLLVKVISPFETVYEGEAYSVSALDMYGSFDVLPGHAKFMALLTDGDVRVNTPSGVKSLQIKHGIIYVTGDFVEVFANA